MQSVRKRRHRRPFPPPSNSQSLSNVSQCLSVTNNGEYWGFQNRCGMAVQFAYCEMSNANPLTACHSTSVSGSVAANGFQRPGQRNKSSEQGAGARSAGWRATGGQAKWCRISIASIRLQGGACAPSLRPPETIQSSAGS